MALALVRSIATGLALCAFAYASHGASAVHKCVVNGTVTFQSAPCPAEKPARRPTTDELNAERKKRAADPAAHAASAPSSTAPPAPAAQGRPEAQNAGMAARDPGLHCDGRQYCSQMRSCAEARFFLANCPGAKMDGNRDGVPCEQQWCTSPFAR